MMKKKIANWGNYPIIESEEKSFRFTEELKDLISHIDRFTPRGNGRCYGDASLAKASITTINYNKILSFDSSTGLFECQSGLTLDKILEIIVPSGWFLPVTPGTKFITVGGAVASDVHGKNHHIDGCFSKHVLEMDILLTSGEMLKCSPNNNADLFMATCGGMGLTGIITRVIFKLKKIETSFIAQKQIKAANLEEVLDLFEKNKHYTYSVAWIDCLKKGKNFGRSILILGEHAGKEEISQKYKLSPLALPNKKQIRFPFYLPSWVLNKLTVSIFNWLFYYKNTRKVINSVVSYEPFFYPLDAILDWNKGYGKKGFIQYQFVVPLEGKQGLVEILKKISDQGIGSFLAVLKIFGDDQSLISFPMKGYTLALDIPVTDKLWPFLDELDKIVTSYGGRLYMSKDARMHPDMLEKGYPGLQEFKEILRKFNPQKKIYSIQSDRLHIT